jgi:glutathione-regulated potassium-efflux system ancillary protein KefF
VGGRGWAYGEGGTALAGKDCLWAITTGGDEQAYSPAGRHRHPLAAFAPVVEQTMRYCGMNWLEPFVVHGAHQVEPEALQAAGADLRARLEGWRAAHGGGDA